MHAQAAFLTLPFVKCPQPPIFLTSLVTGPFAVKELDVENGEFSDLEGKIQCKKGDLP